ncbi:MAG: hypothetical protein MUC59_06240 [Saprospiraceae bacterium]|jgi:hypothetical protein|nr:hypothetical protein [Saprospiraceae bacterium]
MDFNFNFVKQNFDAMEKANKKKPLSELAEINQMQKEKMGEFFGGNEKIGDNKKRGFFAGFFSPGPCSSELPQ